jgi:hypothetical protein
MVSFRANGLQAHNTIRTLYNVSNMTLTDQLNERAQNWSIHMAMVNANSLDGKLSLFHSYAYGVGENVFAYCLPVSGIIDNIPGI